MLVERHRLARELAAEPRGVLHQHDVGAALRGRERGRHAAQPAADDEHRAPGLAHPRPR
jgi:hypothetical protein